MTNLLSSQSSATVYLQSILKHDRVPHLLLFSGGEAAGMHQAAREFAEQFLTQKSGKRPKSFRDIYEITPVGKLGLHSVESIRGVIYFLSLSPYEAKGKVVIIQSSERMLPTSGNLLLKTIEEPSPNSLIIFLASQPKRLLATIRSRCQEVRFGRPLNLENPFTKQVEELFSQKRPFFELSDFAASMQDFFDKRKKEHQASLMEDVGNSYKEMTALGKEGVEEEIEGALFLEINDEMAQLFSAIATAMKNRNPSCIDTVAKALSFAFLSLERSTPLKAVLETFFLQTYTPFAS